MDLTDSNIDFETRFQQTEALLLQINKNTTLLQTALSLACNVIASQGVKPPDVIYQELLKEAKSIFNL